MGCAGALVGWLRRGQVVAASEVVVLDADGRAAERLPACGADVAAAAAARGVRLVPGAVAASGALVTTAAGKAAAAESGAVVVDMESGALAAVARARGIPFVALRAVLDLADEALPFGTDTVDERTGALRLGRTVAALAPPARWRLAWRLCRGRRAAGRALGVAAQCLPADAAPAPGAARRAATA
jgi:adenosylhomocysteine nucleosidase